MSEISFNDLPRELTDMIVASDEQTWRSMRLASTYYHQLLSWDAYVGKFTITKFTTFGYPFESHPIIYQSWFLDGRHHREHDLPAIVSSSGARLWYQYGNTYRVHGRPTEIAHDGNCVWKRRFELHRGRDRPAVIHNDGFRQWYRHGQLHRGHGVPAAISPRGSRSYHVRGRMLC